MKVDHGAEERSGDCINSFISAARVLELGQGVGSCERVII